MKILFLLSTILCLGALSGGDRQEDSPCPDAKAPGRFALLSATYELKSGATNTPQSALFRIDTATGKVWKFTGFRIRVSDSMATDAEGWQPVLEDVRAAVIAIQNSAPQK